jgi:hypothetical protein
MHAAGYRSVQRSRPPRCSGTLQYEFNALTAAASGIPVPTSIAETASVRLRHGVAS